MTTLIAFCISWTIADSANRFAWREVPGRSKCPSCWQLTVSNSTVFIIFKKSVSSSASMASHDGAIRQYWKCSCHGQRYHSRIYLKGIRKPTRNWVGKDGSGGDSNRALPRYWRYRLCRPAVHKLIKSVRRISRVKKKKGVAFCLGQN